MLKDDDLLERLDRDYLSAGLDPRRLALLRYADRLTRAPAEVRASDVAALREVGYTDSDILAIVEVTAYYAYANRIADGLGVAVEPWVEEAIRKELE